MFVTVKMTPARKRILERMPALRELPPAELEHALQIEEDLAEIRSSAVLSERLKQRVAEWRMSAEHLPELMRDVTEEEWAEVVGKARDELRAESAPERNPTEMRPPRANHKAVS